MEGRDSFIYTLFQAFCVQYYSYSDIRHAVSPCCCCAKRRPVLESAFYPARAHATFFPNKQLLTSQPPISLMFSRLAQLTRHFSRPLPNYAHNSAAAFASSANRIMTSSSTANDRNTRTIHTAACLIIGDEVLGGKVCFMRRVGGSAKCFD